MYRHIIICCTCLLGLLFLYTPLAVATPIILPFCPEGQVYKWSCSADRCRGGCYGGGGGGGEVGGSGNCGANCPVNCQGGYSNNIWIDDTKAPIYHLLGTFGGSYANILFRLTDDATGATTDSLVIGDDGGGNADGYRVRWATCGTGCYVVPSNLIQQGHSYHWSVANTPGAWFCGWNRFWVSGSPNPLVNCDPNVWREWSGCSASCGGGTQTRTNTCGTVITQACNTQVCYVTPTPTKVPTSTPVPSTPVPTITPTPTPTPQTTVIPTVVSCTKKALGDANCDNQVDGMDYSIWLNTQCHPMGSQTCSDKRADYNKDGNIDDEDYQIWMTHRN